MLEQFELKLIAKILLSSVLHADETGINIGGENHWLHCLSNPQWALYDAHAKRGSEACIARVYRHSPSSIGLTRVQLNCLHAPCNAHHLRELTYVEEQDQQGWAKQMRELLLGIEQAVKRRIAPPVSRGILYSPSNTLSIN